MVVSVQVTLPINVLAMKEMSKVPLININERLREVQEHFQSTLGTKKVGVHLHVISLLCQEGSIWDEHKFVNGRHESHPFHFVLYCEFVTCTFILILTIITTFSRCVTLIFKNLFDDRRTDIPNWIPLIQPFLTRWKWQRNHNVIIPKRFCGWKNQGFSFQPKEVSNTKRMGQVATTSSGALVLIPNEVCRKHLFIASLIHIPV